jgi:concentrative nucleoside transporter, CNT family
MGQSFGFDMSNLMGLAGVLFLLLVAFIFSNNRGLIKWKLVIGGLILNVLLAFFIVRTSLGQEIFILLAKIVDKVISFANVGTAFVFGPLYTTAVKASAQTLPNVADQLVIKGLMNADFSFSFIYTALVPIIFFGSIMSILYHYGIMQKIVKVMSFFLSKILGLSSAESLGVASNVFVGQTQAPLVIAPYLKNLTSSELFLTMVGGMATVAGSLLYAYQAMGAYLPYVIAASILAAPSAIIMAKIIFPEAHQVPDSSIKEVPVTTTNGLDAIATGAMDGWKIALGVGIMLLSFLAFIAFLDYAVLKITFGHFSLNQIITYVFYPASYLMGVPSSELFHFSTLIGQKTVFNEFIAYSNMGSMFPDIITKAGTNFQAGSHAAQKAYLMACFALTGFANFSSIAIQIGGIGVLAPSRKSEIAKLGLKALLAAILANLLSATIVGILF